MDTGNPSHEAYHEVVPISSRIIYSNRWLTLREDGIMRRDGARGVYGVLQKPPFALIVPYFDEGFYLVEQYRYPVRQRCWEFPAGAWDSDADVDPEAAARRELTEETGLVAERMTPIGRLWPACGHSDQVAYVMVATGLTDGPPRPDPEEIGICCGWFPEEAVWQLIEDGAIADAPAIAALGLFQYNRRKYGW
jgi:8-oxo-dGTP pyrophosphatase MutT (NUDIX family)